MNISKKYPTLIWNHTKQNDKKERVVNVDKREAISLLKKWYFSYHLTAIFNLISQLTEGKNF